MTGPSFCNTARLMSRLQTYSPRDFKKISSLTSVHYWDWFHQGDQTTFSVQLEGGGRFPLGFPSFPHLDLFLSIVWDSLLYRVNYGLSCRGPIISCTLCFYSYEYSLRGGVEDIYPPCTFNLVNLTLLNHYPKFYWLNWHQRSTVWHQHEHTHTYLQSRMQLSHLLHLGRLTGALRECSQCHKCT